MKSGAEVYGCRSSTSSSVMNSFGKFISAERNPRSDIILSEVSYDPSMILPFFPSTQATGLRGNLLSTMTQSKILLTISGGFFSALRAPMSLGEIELSASSAASSAGLAAARSLSASVFTTLISAAFFDTESMICCTFFFSFSAIAVDSEISLSSLTDSFCATSSSWFFTIISFLILEMSFLASSSFSSPPFTLLASSMTSLCLLVYSCLYPDKKLR